jgi:flagellar basal-body rod modification protein FlgD
MTVSSITSTQSATGSSASSASPPTTVDYNQFLQLLIAQMKNQDPTNPTDMSQYMSQFAQMSSVEQAIQTNTKLDTLLSSSALSQAENLIGRTASFTDTAGQDTTGKIVAVRIIQGGAVATLESGVEVQLGPGITLS